VDLREGNPTADLALSGGRHRIEGLGDRRGDRPAGELGLERVRFGAERRRGAPRGRARHGAPAPDLLARPGFEPRGQRAPVLDLAEGVLRAAPAAVRGFGRLGKLRGQLRGVAKAADPPPQEMKAVRVRAGCERVEVFHETGALPADAGVEPAAYLAGLHEIHLAQGAAQAGQLAVEERFGIALAIPAPRAAVGGQERAPARIAGTARASKAHEVGSADVEIPRSPRRGGQRAEPLVRAPRVFSVGMRGQEAESDAHPADRHAEAVDGLLLSEDGAGVGA